MRQFRRRALRGMRTLLMAALRRGSARGDVAHARTHTLGRQAAPRAGDSPASPSPRTTRLSTRWPRGPWARSGRPSAGLLAKPIVDPPRRPSPGVLARPVVDPPRRFRAESHAAPVTTTAAPLPASPWAESTATPAPRLIADGASEEEAESTRCDPSGSAGQADRGSAAPLPGRAAGFGEPSSCRPGAGGGRRRPAPCA